MLKDKTPRYEIIDQWPGRPKICLPIGLDRSQLIEVTPLWDEWATFISHNGAAVYSCKDYYAAAMKASLAF